jgi:hypothetical protein
MDDAEFRHVPRKPGEVGEHDAPVFAEQIPDTFIDMELIGSGRRRSSIRRLSLSFEFLVLDWMCLGMPDS